MHKVRRLVYALLSTTTFIWSIAPSVTLPVYARPAASIPVASSAITVSTHEPPIEQAAAADLAQLRDGRVATELVEKNKIKYVAGRILIEAPPDRVWPILTNPYEFEGKISPHLKQVQVLVDHNDVSVLKCNVSVMCPFPPISYTVESHYTPNKRVDFHRIDGTIKDFRGSWQLASANGGQHTEVIYSMFVDPGFSLPPWLVRQAVKSELIRTLTALREKIAQIINKKELCETRQLAAGHSLSNLPPLPQMHRD